MLLGLVDVAILGHSSPADLGGAAIGRSIAFVALALGIGTAAALEPMASQAVGASEPEVAFRSFLATIRASVIVGVPCAVIAVASSWVLVPLGVAPELVGAARAFLIAQTPQIFFFPLFLAAKAYLQAEKRTAPALVASGVANLLNVVICNLLVRGELSIGNIRIIYGLPKMGAFGAGLAVGISSAVLAGVILLMIRRPPRSSKKDEAIPTAGVLRLGTPIGLQMLAEIGVFSLVAVLAGRLGAVAVSAHQIAIGLASFTFMGALGISSATAVRVGHAIGEGRSPRLPGFLGIAVGGFYMLISSAMFFFGRVFFAHLFTDDPEIANLAAALLMIATLFQFFDGVQGVAAGALRGAGDVRVPFIANVAAHWIIGLPLALLLGFSLGWGARGLWWGLLVGLVVVACLLTWRFAVITKKPIERL